MLAWVGQFLMKDFQAILSLAMSLLTFLFLNLFYLNPCFPLAPSEQSTTNLESSNIISSMCPISQWPHGNSCLYLDIRCSIAH